MKALHRRQQASIPRNSSSGRSVRAFVKESDNVLTTSSLAQGFFRPVLLSNATVDRLLSTYSQSPNLGCPYNTGPSVLTSGTLDKMACSIFGDIVQIGPARFIAQQLRKSVPLYRYRFNYFPTNGTATRGITTGSDVRSQVGGANLHIAEIEPVQIAFAFRSDVLSNNRYDQALSSDVSSAFISFAYSQNPNPGGSKHDLHIRKHRKN